jgi:two-component system, LytTR family, response regulator
MKIRTLIVDDESLARDRLRQLLQNEPEIEIVGECTDGREAVTAIQKEMPDLVFLDIQMPELDGFGVLEAVSPQPVPVIVFVTAHDKFALRAFEVHAVDYLLKPFDRERFQAALRHALEQVKNREGDALARRLSALLTGLKAAPKPSERLAVKSGGRVLFVKINDIDWLVTSHNFIELHVGKESHLLRQTLDAIEARLSPEMFVRINRSTIVNIERIKELHRLFYGDYSITLQDGTKLTLSRQYRNHLKRLSLDYSAVRP